jgi:quercetin dioxygenase-like cupin family protein
MIRKTSAEIPGAVIDKPGFQGMTAHFALTKNDGMPHYALRIMELAPGGHTSLHGHPEEHVSISLKEKPQSWTRKEKRRGSCLGMFSIPRRSELHQIKNAGNKVMRVVCTIRFSRAVTAKRRPSRPAANGAQRRQGKEWQYKP